MTIESRIMQSEFSDRDERLINPDKIKKVQEHNEIFKSLTPYIESRLKILTPVEKIWQPADVLPNLEGPDWRDQLEAFRAETDKLSDGFMVVAAFHGVTEEGLPSYQTGINRFEAFKDQSGSDMTPIAKFVRAWTAEERRHLQSITTFLKLSGRIKMREYEKSVQSLIRNGLNPGGIDGTYAELNPIAFGIYVSVQEEQTEDASVDAGLIAQKEGSPTGYRMFTNIGSDERRHASFYQGIMDKVVEAAPGDSMIEFNKLISKKNGIAMPGALVTSGEDPESDPTDLFKNLVRVEVSMGGYTPAESVNTLEKLIKRWKFDTLKVSGEAADAQENIFKELGKIKRKAAIATAMLTRSQTVEIPWIDGPIVLSAKR